jgi:tetratricopeptide (TPR) repeat protein
LILGRNLPILLLGSALFAGTALADEVTPPNPPAQPEAARPEKPSRTNLASEMTRDIVYWQLKLAESPEDVTTRLALGNAYAMNNRFEDAVREFQKVTHDYPEYKSAWNNLGSAYRAMGRKSRALDAYQRAVKIDPQYALAYYNIGVVYDSAGHFQKALEYYGMAVKFDPTLLDPKKNPQVVKNNRVFAVLLHNYLESSDNLALPLEPAYPPER